MRGAARAAGRRRGPHLPRRAGRAVPGRRPGRSALPAGAGLDPDRLEHVVRTHHPAMVYLIPTHHNPTGLVMPAGHRRRVARLAAEHPGTLFVDDMTLAELPLGATIARPRAPLAAAGAPPGQPGQRRLAVQALLGRPADRLDQGQPGPDRPRGRGQGRRRPGQRGLPAGDHGRAADRRARRHRQVAPRVAAGPVRGAGRGPAGRPARVDLARAGGRAHLVGPRRRPTAARSPRPRSGRASRWSPAAC